MSHYTAPLADFRFLLFSVFKLEAFCREFPSLDELDADTLTAVIEEAAKVCEQVLAPLDHVGDQQGCQWRDGVVVSPEGFKEAYKTFTEGGWGALGGHPDFGGMGMPKTLVSVVEEMMQGANMAFGLAPMLTAGACLALQAHGSDELKALYLSRMYSGQWCGAMDLTEAHCGTDLGLMRSKAIPSEDGSYQVSGSKIFITWGEHDMAENIVHLVLAKLPDAPAGSAGISMFLVPKYLPDEQGNIGEFNHVSCGSIEHKMGIHGSATCVMNFDGAKGWLVGAANRGLACMFTMMNYERLVVGIQGIGIADASYQTAKSYALERLQGRSPTGNKLLEQPADPIIVHPDVRRMLMDMKSLNEASRAFYIYVASWLDRAKYTEDTKARAFAEARVALLTPIAKAFMTDRALDCCVLGQQVLGGHGYIQEWQQEQRVRDVRITQIYEGTNGIQAMDLIGRKTVMCKGELIASYIDEMRQAHGEAVSLGVDERYLDAFAQSLTQLEQLTLNVVAQSDANFPGAIAVDYLDAVGYVSFAYMWLKMLIAIQQDSTLACAPAKKKIAQYYADKMLPKVAALAVKVEAGCSSMMQLEDDEF